MSTLSNLLIDLKKSSDYVRFSAVLHGLACVALYLSHDGFKVCCAAFFVSLWSMKRILRSPKPCPDVYALLYTRNTWMMILTGGECKTYQHLHICLDAGFFTLLRLSLPNSKKYLVIFHDQLSQEALKMLYVLANIKKNREVFDSLHNKK